MWNRKKSHVALIPLPTENDDKVGRTKVQLSSIGNDAENGGTFAVLILFIFTEPV